MKETFLYSGTYEDIIQTLGQWRILDLKALKQEVNYHFSYQAFAKMVGKLEKHEYLGSFHYQNNKKYLYLTSKGLEEAGLKEAWPINKDIVLHDLITVNVFKYFLAQKEFKGGNIYLETGGSTTRPDSVLIFENNHAWPQNMALEIELTPKGSSRVEGKFKKYLQESTYDLVLYVFQKPSVFKTYKGIIEEMDKDINPLSGRMFRDRIILLIEPEVKSNAFELMDSPCYFKAQMTDLRTIFKQHLKLVH